MKDLLIKWVRTILSTALDLKDAEEGEIKVERAAREVNWTLRILEARKQNIRGGRKGEEK